MPLPSSIVWREAMACILLGAREAFTPRAMLTSVTMWFATAAVWLVVFLMYCEPLLEKVQFLVTLLVFGAAILMPGVLAFGTGMAGAAVGAAVALGGGVLLSWVLLACAYLAVVVLSVRILLEFVLMGRVQKQALRRYPSLTSRGQASTDAGKNNMGRDLRNGLGPWAGLLGGLVCLVLPFVGGMALFVLLSYLNVRFLVNDAMQGLADARQVREFVSTHRLHMLSLGLLLTATSFVPLLGLLMPWLSGSAVCHLCMRQLSHVQAAAPLAATSVAAGAT